MNLSQFCFTLSSFFVTVAFSFPLTNREQGAIFIDQGFITVNVGNDWMSNGVRASFDKAEQCREPLPRDLKLVLVKLLSATSVTDAVGAQAGIIGAQAENDHSLSRAAAREGVRAASAGLLVEMMSNRLVNLIQDKTITHYPIRAIHFKANCIWVNGKPIDKLLLPSGPSCGHRHFSKNH